MGTGRGSVTQDGGTSNTVLRRLWRRQGKAVKHSSEVCFGGGDGMEDRQIGGQGGTALSLDEGILI
eukprot:14825420-Ditylum_brightwellii.AAC.1